MNQTSSPPRGGVRRLMTETITNNRGACLGFVAAGFLLFASSDWRHNLWYYFEEYGERPSGLFMAACEGLTSLPANANPTPAGVTVRAMLAQVWAEDCRQGWYRLRRRDHLVLDQQGITDLQPLSEMVGLKRLSLRHNAIKSTTPLASLASLTALRLSHNRLTSLAGVSQLEALEFLELENNLITHLGDLKSMRNLRVLKFAQNNVQDIAPLNGLPRLGWIYGAGNQLDRLNLDDLPRIFYMDFGGNRIVSLGGINRLASLEQLYLSNNLIRDLHPLAGIPRLSVLDLSGNQVADLSPLQSVMSLKTLTIRDNPVERSIARGLGGCPDIIQSTTLKAVCEFGR